MTSARDQHLANIGEIRRELLDILEGMERSLDWRPDPESWSAREVLTHMLYTPPGGVPGIFKGILSGQVQEYDLWADQKYMTSKAEGWTLEEVNNELSDYFLALEEALDSTTDDFLEQTAVVHQRNRMWDEPRPVQWLVERLFAGHWREHLEQLRELKEGAQE